MPIKKKTTAAKKPAAKKPAVLGPKAKLMKLLVGTLRTKAKKLGISDVSKRTKENLAQSIMLAEARKKRGTAMGKKATAKKRTMAAKDENRQTGSSDFTRDYDRFAELPGKRNAKDTGNVYYERRKNRSDADMSFTGLQGMDSTDYAKLISKLILERYTLKEFNKDALNITREVVDEILFDENNASMARIVGNLAYYKFDVPAKNIYEVAYQALMSLSLLIRTIVNNSSSTSR
jgi:hypothetical protein